MDNQNLEKENAGHIVTADELTMDEATIIREQERLANEKKRKASAKKKKIVFSILFVVLAAGIWYLGWGRKLLAKEEETTVKIESASNQTVSFAKVNSINGNEINVTELEAIDTISENSRGGGVDAGSMPEGFSPDSMPEGFSPDSMPEGFSPDSMPEGFDAGSMPEGFNPGTMPDGFSSGDFSQDSISEDTSSASRPERSSENADASGNFSKSAGRRTGGQSGVLTYDGVSYSLTDETKTTLIPVGVVVTTKLGTETTFSRISAGDCLALVTEVIDGEETIISVYIVG